MQVGSLTVPVSADLGPITADLARLKKQLEEINGLTGGRGGQSPFGQLEREVKRAKDQTNSLTAALKPFAAALAGVFSARALINFTNTWTDLSSRVNIAAGSVEKGTAVMSRLGDMARRTYSSLELTTETYIRNATTLRDLGKSTEETLNYTEALNNALVVSGARGDVAARVQDALGKAMASGVLRGDQLNTVIESGGRVAEVLAEKIGTTVSGLRKLGSEGKITGDVVYNALTKRLEQLTEQAESMPATIGDAFQLLANALLQTVGVFDSANEVSGTLAGMLITVADNMQRVVTYAATGATMWGAYKIAVLAVNAGLFTMVGALTAVRVALQRLLFATVIGGIVVVLGELINKLWEARQASESWGDAFIRVGSRLALAFDGVKFAFYALTESMQAAWTDLMSYILRSTNENFGPVLRLFGMSAEQVDATLGRLAKSSENLWATARSSAIIASEQIKAAFADFEGSAGTDLSGDGGTNRTTPEVDKKGQREAERLAKAYKGLIDDSVAFVRQQELERQAIGMTELEAAKLRAEFDLLNAAQRAGIVLTRDQEHALISLAHAEAEAEHATNKLREAYEFNKDVFKGFFTDLKSSLQNGASIWEAFGTAASNALQKIADKALDMALNGIFDMIFNSFNLGGGGGGGNWFTNLFKKHENGTSFAPGGWSVVGERGPELMKLPSGTQVTANNRVMAPSQASFGGSGGMQQSIALDVFVKDDGKIGAIARAEAASVVQVTIHDYDTNQLPDSVQRVNSHPRMRYK